MMDQIMGLKEFASLCKMILRIPGGKAAKTNIGYCFPRSSYLHRLYKIKQKSFHFQILLCLTYIKIVKNILSHV